MKTHKKSEQEIYQAHKLFLDLRFRENGNIVYFPGK